MGHAQRLASLGRALGFGVTIVDEVIELEGKASSTAIRQALHAGEPETAAELLGTWWIADGVVESLIHPRHGIYAVRARIDRQGDWLDGVANFGRTPTTGIRDPLLETHIFDFDGDLYGKWLEVQLISFIRPELKFADLDALVEAMHADAAEARKRLANL